MTARLIALDDARTAIGEIARVQSGPLVETLREPARPGGEPHRRTRIPLFLLCA